MLLDIASLASPLAPFLAWLAASLASALAAPLAVGLAAAVITASSKRASADAREPDLKTIERAAADGDAEAQYRLSMILKEGVLTEWNLEASTSLLLTAAGQEHPAAMLELARRYRDGEGLPQDEALSARWTALAEEIGDEGDSGPPSSGPPDLSDEEFLDLLISTGVDVEELYRRFVESFETDQPFEFADLLTPELLKAMFARHTGAEGSGDPEPPSFSRWRSVKPLSRPSPAPSDPIGKRDFERMLRLSGLDELQTRRALADAYTLGEGVEVDLDEAFKQNRLAAELGDEGSSLNVGVMLLSGTGTLSDIEEATPLLRRGLALGFSQTPYQLWIVSCQRPDLVSPDEGLEFLKRSADMGFPAAMAALASGPPSGDVQRLVQAARRGDIDAVYMLAERCRQGPPEERDHDKAMIMYKQAAENGHLKAARTLERIHRIGAGTPADDGEADKWRQLGDLFERDMARREESVKKAAKKPAKKADKKPLKKADKKPLEKADKKPLEKAAKKPKTASGKKPDEK